MSVKLKMHDAAIGFIGSSFDLIAAVCYSFVTQPWQLYAGSYTNIFFFFYRKPSYRRLRFDEYCELITIPVPVIDIFHGAAFTVSTSMASKLVDNSELGECHFILYILFTRVRNRLFVQNDRFRVRVT